MPKYPQYARTTPVPAILVVISLLLSTACQTTPTNLDRTAYDRQLRGADGYLFESDRRYITMQFTQSTMHGVVDSDSFIAYLSVPWSARDGFDFGDPGVAVGWSSVAAVFSDMFNGKEGGPGRPLPESWRNGANWLPTQEEMLRISDELTTVPDLAVIQEFQAGTGPQVVDYGALFDAEPTQLEIAGVDPQDRATD